MTREELILKSFEHHSPTEDQVKRILHVRESFICTAKVLLLACPESADRTAALRQLHEAMMTANKSIACELDGK